MDAMEIQPQDALRAGEASEGAETRALDDATFEPGDHLEQTGDFRQAEAIQTSLESVMYSITTERIPDGTLPYEPGAVDASQATPDSTGEPGGESAIPISIPGLQTGAETVGALPIPVPRPEQGGESLQAVLPEDSLAGHFPSLQEGPFEPPDGGEDEGDNITPINLPGPQSVAGEVIDLESMVKEPAGPVEIPLPSQVKEPDGMVEAPLPGTADEIACDGSSKEPAYQIGHKEPGGTAEIPLPSPEEEIGFKFYPKEPTSSVETPLPGTIGEIGIKLGDGELQVPLPSPSLEGVRMEQATIDLMVARTQAVVEQMSEESDPQFLLLQQQMQLENQTFSMMSNILKPFSDTPDDAIKNIR